MQFSCPYLSVLQQTARVYRSQTELEERVENLAEIVVRPNLRTPRNRIIYTTKLAKRKRSDFLRALENGLIPPETSPSLWKRRHHFIEVWSVLRTNTLAC